MSFKDLDSFFRIKPIRLPICGKTYEFPGSVSARTGLLLHRMTEMVEEVERARRAGDEPNLDATALDDGEEVDLRREVFGSVQQQMIDDAVPSVYVEHALKTLIVWHQFGEKVAEAVWKDVPGAPKAPADRKPRKATSGAATTTKRRGSTSGTKKSTQASGGEASSPTGV